MSPWKNISKLSAKDEAKREAEFQARLLAELGPQTPAKSASPAPAAAPKLAADGISISVTANGLTTSYALDAAPLTLRQRILNVWLAKPPATEPAASPAAVLMTPQSYYRCWVEVDLDALRHNVAAIRRRIPVTTQLMAVVKADAYGHGLAPVAGMLMQCGVDEFAVANLTEALALRQVGGPGWPILLFGSALPFEVDRIIEQSITPTISTLEEARLFEAAAAHAGRRFDVQVEIDTGMGRVGFGHEEAGEVIPRIAALPHLNVTALYTHFPSADDNLDETRRQLDAFLRVAYEVRQLVPQVRRLHAANSAALLNLPESHLDVVRPGLLLYGIPPVVAHRDGAPGGRVLPDEFHPVLSFKARVAFVKNVEAGRTISYGQTFVATKSMKIATIAAGYADGFSRFLSNKAEVLIGGDRCPVVGRITMDQIMADVTGRPAVGCGDEVVFIGRQGTAEISASEVARWEETIPWEVLCGITKTARVPRLYRGAFAA